MYFKISVCMYVCSWYGCRCLQPLMCMWRSKDTLWCWLSLSTLFEIGSLFCVLVYLPFNTTYARLAGLWVCGVLLSILPTSLYKTFGITDVCYCIQLYMGSRDLNSGPHTCTTSTLPLSCLPNPDEVFIGRKHTSLIYLIITQPCLLGT